MAQLGGAAAVSATGGTTFHWSWGSWTYGAGGGAGGTVWIVAGEVDLAADSVEAIGGLGEQTHIRLGGNGGVGRVRVDCDVCNGFAVGTLEAAAALEAASEPDPGWSEATGG